MALERPREPGEDPDKNLDRPNESDQPRPEWAHPSEQDPAIRLAQVDRHRKLVDAGEAEYAEREAAGMLLEEPKREESPAEETDPQTDASTSGGTSEGTAETDGALDTGPDDEPLTITRGELKQLLETGKVPQSATDRWSDGSGSSTEHAPETGRGWRTITEEIGESKSWPSFDSAKKELGSVPGMDLEHIVEQCQAKPERSGFDITKINSSDNLARVPKDVNAEKAAEYSRKGLNPLPLRDMLNGLPWEEQYEIGRDMLDEKTRRRHDTDD